MNKLVTALVLLLAGTGLLATPAASAASGSRSPKPTIVLVHGA
jgi:hypothetical protein